MDELLKIQEEALAKISACADAKELNDLRVFYLGKKGPIQAAMKSMKTMAPEERKTFGQVSNKTKQEIGQAIEEKKAYLEEKALNERLLAEDIDISLPGNRLPVGSVHPLTRVKGCTDPTGKRLPGKEISISSASKRSFKAFSSK